MEMNEIIKQYIMSLLELQETRLNCINLSFNKPEDIKVELSLIQKSKDLINKI